MPGRIALVSGHLSAFGRLSGIRPTGEPASVSIDIQPNVGMGRRRRQSGHSQPQSHYRVVVPRQQKLHASQPHPDLPSQPHQQHWHSSLPQSGAFPSAEHTYALSTTELPSPVSNRSTLSRGSIATSGTGYTAALDYARHLSPDVDTPTSSTASVSMHHSLRHADRANEGSLHPTFFASASLSDPDHPMTGEAH